MNYLDIRERQGPSYFIICLYFKDEKKLLDVSLLMNFNYYFKINPLNCCLHFIHIIPFIS